MTKDKLITKQQLEIEELKEFRESVKATKAKLAGMLYSIGQPLNDNALQFNKEQLKWCFKINDLLEGL